jgi:hypothetical protein
LKAGFGLTDAGEASLATQDYQGLEERRGVFASADGNPYGLEHWTGFETERLGGFAQCLV